MLISGVIGAVAGVALGALAALRKDGWVRPHHVGDRAGRDGIARVRGRDRP